MVQEILGAEVPDVFMGSLIQGRSQQSGRQMIDFLVENLPEPAVGILGNTEADGAGKDLLRIC